MRHIDYVSIITEDADTLLSLERSTSASKPRQRLQLLRFLKTGSAETMPVAAALIGLSSSQASALWRIYKNQGLEALLATGYKGRIPRLNAHQIGVVQEQCAKGFGGLTSAQAWIEQHVAVRYSTSGVWRLFQRLNNKKKTGRFKHYKQDLEAQETFKKNL